MNLWTGIHLNNEWCPKTSTFTFHFYWPSHFLDNIFANAQTEPCSLAIKTLRVCQFTEIVKEFSDIFFFNTYSLIFNNHFKWYKIFIKPVIIKLVIILRLPLCILIKILFTRHQAHRNLSFLKRKLQCIRQEIQQYLCIPSFVSNHIIYKWQKLIINFKNQLYFFFNRKKIHGLKGSLYCLSKIKRLVIEVKSHLLSFSKIHHVIN